MATTCSHQDKTRREVSATALLAAFLRSVEMKMHPEDSIFDDPYAEFLAGDYKLDYSKAALEGDNPESKRTRRLIKIGPVRTRKIDDYMKEVLLSDPSIHQICVLGAGVDARPWRLQTERSDQAQIKYFEVDFPEIFDYKLPILQAHGAKEKFDFKRVDADLSVPTWLETLEEAGFDRSKRTLWLLEGLTGYLTEEELRKMFRLIGEASTADSTMIVTFLTPAILGTRKSLHQFAPENPSQFVEEYGWHGVFQDVEDCCVELNRANLPDDVQRGYFLGTLTLSNA